MDIYFINSNDGWFVDDDGKIYHYNSIGWAFHSDLDVYTYTYHMELEFLNSSEGWFVYSSSYAKDSDRNGAYSFNGTTLTLYENSEYRIYQVVSLHGITGSNIWAVGYDGVIFNFNGSRWNQITSPTIDDLFGLFMLSHSDGWAVGSNGVILRYH